MNLFFHFILSNFFISFLLAWIFFYFFPTRFLGGFWFVFVVAVLGSSLFSSLIPSCFSFSQYGILYWFLYYALPALGALVSILLLKFVSKNKNDI